MSDSDINPFTKSLESLINNEIDKRLKNYETRLDATTSYNNIYKKVSALEEKVNKPFLGIEELTAMQMKLKDIEEVNQAYYEPMMTAWNHKHEERIEKLESGYKTIERHMHEYLKITGHLDNLNDRVTDVEEWKRDLHKVEGLTHFRKIVDLIHETDNVKIIDKQTWEEIKDAASYLRECLLNPVKECHWTAHYDQLQNAIQKVDPSWCPND